jgi:putative PIN family toxin of toxin-antitoxin system
VRRVVLDPNVLVSALISPAGVPAQVIEAVLDGEIAHVASLRWLSEADDLAARPRFRRWFTEDEAETLIERLWIIAEVFPDPPSTASHTRDSGDDYLVALAVQSGCDTIVSGDSDLLAFTGPPQVLAPRQLLDRLSKE